MLGLLCLLSRFLSLALHTAGLKVPIRQEQSQWPPVAPCATWLRLVSSLMGVGSPLVLAPAAMPLAVTGALWALVRSTFSVSPTVTLLNACSCTLMAATCRGTTAIINEDV